MGEGPLNAFEPELFGRYLLLERDEGAADVFAARALDDPATAVTLERFSGERARDTGFLQGVRTAASLRHANLQRIVDLGRVGDEGFLARERVEGRGLEAVLARCAAEGEVFPPTLAVWVAVQVCKALHHVHSRTDASGFPSHLAVGCVDAAHVMVSFDGDVVLDPMGTAPADEAAQAADVRAVAHLLHRLLTGVSHDAAVDDARAHGAGVSAELAGVLADAAGDTPPTARALGDALLAALPATPDDASLRDAVGAWMRDLFAEQVVAHRHLGVEQARRAAEALRERAGRALDERIRASRGRRLRGMLAVVVVALLVLAGLGGMASSRETTAPEIALPELGALAVAVSPPGRVLLGDRVQGEGAAVDVAELPPGPHRLRLEAEAHEAAFVDVLVPRAGTLHVAAELEPIPEIQPASIRVTSRPSGAEVTVDGRLVGVTPVRVQRTPGSRHRIVVSRDGFREVSRRVGPLDPGERADVSVTLSPATAGGGSRAARGEGALRVVLEDVPWAHVYVDARKLPQTAPFSGLSLTAGRHTVRVENPAAGLDVTRFVDVMPGAEVVVRAAP